MKNIDKVKNYRFSVSEKIANYLNEVDKIKEKGVTVGIVGEDLLLQHNTTDKTEQQKERREVAKELVKLGLGYKTKLGKFDRVCKLTLFNIDFKISENVFKVNLEYYSNKLKRKQIQRLKRFSFQSEALCKAKSKS